MTRPTSPRHPTGHRRGSSALSVMIVAFIAAAVFTFWLILRRNEEARAKQVATSTGATTPVSAVEAPAKTPDLTPEQRRERAIEQIERQPSPVPRFDPAAEVDKVVSPVRRPAVMASPLDKRIWSTITATDPSKPLAKAPFHVPPRHTDEHRTLTALLAEYAQIPAQQCVRHPLAKEFPGDVPDSVPRLRTLFSCNRGVKGWTSTGFYAPPGEIITIELSEYDATRGLSLLIGSHTDNLTTSLNTEWKRFPEVCRRFPLDKTTVHVANPFGGLVYLTDAQNIRPERPIQLLFSGVVKAPVYVQGKTSAVTWAKQRLVTKGVPWGEIIGERMSLVLPGEQLRATIDPKPYATHWDDVVKAQYRLVNLTWDSLRHERLVPDAQLSYGVMHPGYPIVTRLDHAAELTATGCLTDDNWGVNHEIGHNLQRKEWTFRGYGETTNNLLGLYAMEVASGVKLTQVRGGMNWRAIQTQAIAFPGNDDPFVLLSFYSSPITQFGWEPLRKTFATYDTEPIGNLNDADKKAEFVFRWSVACDVDLRKYAALFGFPENAHSQERFATLLTPLKTWMPQGCPPSLIGVKHIRRVRDPNSNEDSHLEARRAAAEAAAAAAAPPKAASEEADKPAQ